MKTLSQTETSSLSLLLNWAADRISRTMAAIKPKHRAAQIAADIAVNGNPSAYEAHHAERPGRPNHTAATRIGLELCRHPLLAGVAQTLVNAMKLFQ